MPLRARAVAKLNLGLHVLRRREDGYHAIETVFVPIGWSDTLAAEPADRLALTCSDPALPTDAGNLVWRAAEALAAEAGVPPRARLHLDKRVPYGAGLGSGSSDAAATLLLLRDLWQVPVSDEALYRLAAGLGADVPFFLDPRPSLGTGLGADLAPLAGADGAPYRCPFWLVVAVPGVHVNTGEAYGLVSPRGEGRPDLGALVASNDLARWRRDLVNDFEAPVVAQHPAIGALRDGLRDAGAGYAAMSGSGSAVFGVFEREGAARGAAEAAERAGARVHLEAPGGEG